MSPLSMFSKSYTALYDSTFTDLTPFEIPYLTNDDDSLLASLFEQPHNVNTISIVPQRYLPFIRLLDYFIRTKLINKY